MQFTTIANKGVLRRRLVVELKISRTKITGATIMIEASETNHSGQYCRNEI
jgi:hypothetical protein